ncbi:MAG: thiamine-phosphate pyrophosphorylase [Firmicutes bacterium]|nr:thiamine-phosphate pyrophosphorylase [Bacillota bacterium]
MVNRKAMKNFLATNLYGLTAEEYSRGRSNIETVKLMLDAGIRVIQYREKSKTIRQMYGECQLIRQMTQVAGASFIVNDHVDLALLVEADGVHIGQDDLPPEKVRRLIGPELVLGLSTHSPKQAQQAAALGDTVDYIGVGPIFFTKTKKDVCHPVGLEYLDYVVGNIRLPLVAIGGIKESNAALVKQHGARMVALVSEIVGAADIPEKVKALRHLLT